MRTETPDLPKMDLYDWAASGSDFTFYQDLGLGRYDEYYFNPDCVFILPRKRQVVWFDCDHLSAGSTQGFARRHLPWDIWRKKFAFLAQGNRLSLLVYTFTDSWVKQVVPFRSQGAVRVRYGMGEPYRLVGRLGPGAPDSGATLSALRSAWESHKPIKVGLHLGEAMLIFPIRTAFRLDGLFSFVTRTIAIPEASMEEFSWEQAAVGQVAVSSDGSCSIFRWKKSRVPFQRILAACFPGLLSWSFGIFEPIAHPAKERLRQMLCRWFGGFLKRVAPYEIQCGRTPMSIFISEKALGGTLFAREPIS
ncbi:MAG: hypothetical protein HYZ90_03825 [Candidatus Omnitrophica bacterium]|nr:hypothetical protein [Candidatus Omnitrophota bacterium]